jgi:hypothetical protein
MGRMAGRPRYSKESGESDMWAELNERQRDYLRAIYDCDQTTEAGRRERAARGFYDRTPASEWRWQMYGPADSALYTTLRTAGLVDPGTGSTWQALEDRKLVQCRYVPDAFGVQLLEVQITALGRKAVRAATGEQRPKPLPKGQLRERQWAALARLYAAGDKGLSSAFMLYGEYNTNFKGFSWTRTLIALARLPAAAADGRVSCARKSDAAHALWTRLLSA